MVTASFFLAITVPVIVPVAPEKSPDPPVSRPVAGGTAADLDRALQEATLMIDVAVSVFPSGPTLELVNPGDAVAPD
jgi:hypothetical protein